MKKIITLLGFLLLIITVVGYSQSKGNVNKDKRKSSNAKWTTNPYDHRMFIANKGQFDDKVADNEKILYAAQLGNIWAYFTAKGVVYSYAEPPKQDDDDKDKGKDPDANGGLVVAAKHYLFSNWVGASPASFIKAEDELNYYYTYPNGTNQTFTANIYRKITYKDIYPGIDIEYYFPKEKEGLEYSVIVHPGADISLVKLNYDKTGKLKIKTNGDIVFGSKMGQFTEHAPVSYYSGENENIPVSFSINENTESFSVNGIYDRSKTLVIDPWITDPLFTVRDRAYDLDWDYKGNVYAYGGNCGVGLQLAKINSSGGLIWVYNVTTNVSLYGDFAVDKNTGTCYVGLDCCSGTAIKVNTNGLLLTTYNGNPNMDEIWRMEFDACNDSIIIAGGGTQGHFQAGVLDTNMTTVNPVNVLGAVGNDAFHDMSLLTIDPDGKECYMASAKCRFGSNPQNFNNQLMKLPLPSLSPTAYQVSDNFNFQEIGSITYGGNLGAGSSYLNGMNGATASPNWLYIYNGDTLKRIVKNTGALSTQITIRQHSPYEFGGLDVDPCDNLFVGVADSMYVLNSSLSVINKIALFDTVYDIHLGQNNVIYACGKSYVTQFANPNPSRLISTVGGTPTSCTACDGTATPSVNCGVAPYSFLWSDGQTSQTATGLCSGLYTVTVTDGACPPHTDTSVVSISGKAGYYATVVDTDPSCSRTFGNITVIATGGNTPYTYSWAPVVQTSAKITGLTAGTYSCTITDHTGCDYFIATTLVNIPPPVIIISPPVDSFCTGGSAPLRAFGVKTYNWLPNTNLSCNTCANPTATPTINTTYSVSGVDSNGCSASATVLIKVLSNPKPVITGKDSICRGYRDTLVATGGNVYLWLNNFATTDTIFVSPTNTRTYTVQASNGVCPTHDTTFKVTIVPSPVAQISPQPDSVCIGDSALLTASGGATYLWSTGQTATSIWVHPTTATTYTLTAFSGTCSNLITGIVGIKPSLIATMGAAPDTICGNGNSTLSVNVTQGGPVTYKWSNLSTASSIIVNPSLTTTYSATVYGQCDTLKFTKTVHVLPAPTIDLNPFDTVCQGNSITLTAHGGGTYKWSNNATTSSIQVSPTSNTTYTVVVDSGCTASATAAVDIDNAVIQVCCDDSIKIGASVQLTAKGASTYAWTPTSALSCTACPNPIASPTLTTTYTVTGNNTDGCPAAGDVTVFVIDNCADFVVPNTFTPNNDGINDDFAISTKNLSSYNIIIYDRWGKQMYTSSNPDIYWNGRINGTENLAPDGVYYYIITASCASNNYNKKGFVEVVGEK